MERQSAVTPEWARSARRDIREQMLWIRFDEVLRRATEGADRATAEGDAGLWRRFACDESTALFHLGRVEESVARADAVVASAERDGVPEDMARAWNVSAIGAHRLGNGNDALRRLDGALAVGEQMRRDAHRIDVLGKAACSAGAIGLVELGDTVFEEVLGDLTTGAAGEIAPSTVLWLVGQHVVVRIWRGLAEEHADRPDRAPQHFDGAVQLCRQILSWPGVPPVPTAAIRGMHGLALTALGRHDGAATEIVAARAVLPAEPFQVYTGGVELTTGLSALRAVPPVDAATLHATGRRLTAVAGRCADVRAEADVWRHWALAAERIGDHLRAGVARERFEAVAERLEWRQRLDGATLLTFRSTTLTRIARGDSWIGDDVTG